MFKDHQFPCRLTLFLLLITHNRCDIFQFMHLCLCMVLMHSFCIFLMKKKKKICITSQKHSSHFWYLFLAVNEEILKPVFIRLIMIDNPIITENKRLMSYLSCIFTSLSWMCYLEFPQVGFTSATTHCSVAEVITAVGYIFDVTSPSIF